MVRVKKTNEQASKQINKKALFIQLQTYYFSPPSHTHKHIHLSFWNMCDDTVNKWAYNFSIQLHTVMRHTHTGWLEQLMCVHAITLCHFYYCCFISTQNSLLLLFLIRLMHFNVLLLLLFFISLNFLISIFLFGFRLASFVLRLFVVFFVRQNSQP